MCHPSTIFFQMSKQEALLSPQWEAGQGWCQNLGFSDACSPALGQGLATNCSVPRFPLLASEQLGPLAGPWA